MISSPSKYRVYPASPSLNDPGIQRALLRGGISGSVSSRLALSYYGKMSQSEHEPSSSESNSLPSEQMMKSESQGEDERNCEIPRICSSEEWENLKIGIQAAIAVHFNILFWVGLNNLLIGPMRNPSELTKFLLPPSWCRDSLYIAIGLFVLVVTDSLYGNAGLPGTYYPEAFHSSKTFSISRAVFGLIGSVFCWTGMFTLIDSHTFKMSITRDSIILLIGFAGLAMTNTFYDMAFAYPPGVNVKKILSSSSPLMSHIKCSLRAFLSIIFQVMIWVGSFNLLEFYAEPSVWRESTYLVSGIFLYWATNTFIPQSYIIITNDGSQEQLSDITLEIKSHGSQAQLHLRDYISIHEHQPTIIFYARALISLSGQVIHNTGVWAIVDLYSGIVDSPLRNSLYMLVGLILLGLSGVLQNNTNITPIVTPVWDSPQIPSGEEVADVADAAKAEVAESVDEDLTNASILQSAVAIFPNARGRVQRLLGESETFEEENIDEIESLETEENVAPQELS